MTREIRLQIPFASLVDAIASLELEEKQQLWQLLNEEIIQAEEDLLEQDPIVQDEIQEARAAFQAGDYQTLEEYIAQRSKTAP